MSEERHLAGGRLRRRSRGNAIAGVLAELGAVLLYLLLLFGVCTVVSGR